VVRPSAISAHPKPLDDHAPPVSLRDIKAANFIKHTHNINGHAINAHRQRPG
jgi:hypothetical protein